jgi:hypothetical protein
VQAGVSDVSETKSMVVYCHMALLKECVHGWLSWLGTIRQGERLCDSVMSGRFC